jgi:dipeptidyl aminopeptidase/acylaminoacyl peptidase
MVPFNQSVLMYEKLTACNKTVEFYKVMGADHGLHFWTAEVMDIAIKFLGAYLL